MINWIKYDPKNPPETGKVYLVWTVDDTYESELPWTALYENDHWEEDGYGEPITGVSHYAVINRPINLPGEETEE